MSTVCVSNISSILQAHALVRLELIPLMPAPVRPELTPEFMGANVTAQRRVQLVTVTNSHNTKWGIVGLEICLNTP